MTSVRSLVAGAVALALALFLLIGVALFAGEQAAQQQSADLSGTASSELNTSAIPAASQYLVPYLEDAGSLCPQITAPLLAAQIQQESGWNATAVSPSGAEGISQFLPSTWPSWSQPPATSGPDTPLNAPDAVLAQGRFLCALAAQMAALAAQTGTDVVSLALAGYNAGSASVIACGCVPNNGQTSQYVARILAGEATYTSTTVLDSSSSFGLAVVAAAEKELGVPYSWGGGTFTGPSLGIDQGAGTVGFDCSGLVLYSVFQASGGTIKLPHSSETQATLGQAVTSGLGSKVLASGLLQVGGIIGFALEGGSDIDHIGIYIGAGKMIAAPHTGGVVEIDDLTSSYWQSVPWVVRSFAPAVTLVSAAGLVTPRAPSGPYVTLAPGGDVAAAVNAAPAGTSFLLADGQYHVYGLAPKDGDEIVGQSRDGVVLEGDGQRDAFTGSAANVLLDNFTVTGYSPGRLNAAVDGTHSSGWQFLNLHVTGNSEEGLAVGPGSLVDNSLFDYNGNVGIGTGNVVNPNGSEPIPGLTYTIEHTETSFNGGQDSADAGGIKTLWSTGARFIDDYSHSNRGAGIWCDAYCANTIYDGDVVSNNLMAGIFYEISWDATIENCTVTGNSLNANIGNLWGANAGIDISDSHNVVVEHNVVTGNQNSVIAFNGHSGTSMLYDVNVHANVLSGGLAGVFTSGDPQAAATSSFSGNS